MKEVVCLELPIKVVNIRDAITAVGGSDKIAKVISDGALMDDTGAFELRLRKDVFHHPIKSLGVHTNTIAVEITMPYRFRLRRNLKDSVRFAQFSDVEPSVVPKYLVTLTHRFRALSDFQYYTGDSSFALEMKKSLCVGNFDNILKVELNAVKTPTLCNDIFPPPRFSVNSQPLYYTYHQSPHVRIIDETTGEKKILTSTADTKVMSSLLTWGEEVPTAHPLNLTLSPKASIQDCVNALKILFDERPSYIRRSLQYRLGHILSRQLKFALPYVSYYYKSGPWRGAYIRFGVDPAKTPSMAKYQVEHFRISSEDDTKKPSTTPTGAYVFDGTTYPDVPMLQLADIADSFLEKYISTKALRTTVDENDGWFPGLTMVIIRRVLRAELVSLNQDNKVLTFAEKTAIIDGIREENDSTA